MSKNIQVIMANSWHKEWCVNVAGGVTMAGISRQHKHTNDWPVLLACFSPGCVYATKFVNLAK